MKKSICFIILAFGISMNSLHALNSVEKGSFIAGAIGLAGTVCTKNPKIIVPVTLASAVFGGLIGKSEKRKGRRRRRKCFNNPSAEQRVDPAAVLS